MISRAINREELRQIALKFGTPSYVYDARIVEDRIQSVRTSLPTGAVLLYALKANYLPRLSKVFIAHGVGVDVVSPGELILALRLGYPTNRILFSANNMTDEEMCAAFSSGVLLNIGELTRLDKFGARFPGSRVSLRINPQHGAGHHEHVVTAGRRSKFGIPLQDLTSAKEIATNHDLTIVGLHQHIGSGNLDLGPYRKAIPVLFDAASSFEDLEFLNIGGGLGVPYRPDDSPVDLNILAELLNGEIRQLAEARRSTIQIWMEPGRYLTAEAGALLVTVNTVKESFGQVFVGTDSGMSHLVRPAIYGAYHEVVNVTNPDGPERLYNIVGNICESSDFFAHERRIAEIREGDTLAILDSGAYGMAMASEYNLRPLPREVFIETDGTPVLAREAETADELVHRLLRQTGLER